MKHHLTAVSVAGAGPAASQYEVRKQEPHDRETQNYREFMRLANHGTVRALRDTLAGTGGRTLNQESEEDRMVARAILHYLQAHPDAKDTLEGIAQWWLLRECTERRLAEVQRGVAILLAQNLVFENRREGLRPHYGLNPAKQEEISKILRGSKG